MLECLDDLAQGTAVGGGSVKSLKKNDRKNQKMTVRNTRVSGNYKLLLNCCIWIFFLVKIYQRLELFNVVTNKCF